MQKSLIFQNVTLKGFWLTQWKRNQMKGNKQKLKGLLCKSHLHSLSLSDKVQLKLMLDHVCDLMRDGHLTPPHCVQTPFHQYTHALHATVQSHQRKHVLIM